MREELKIIRFGTKSGGTFRYTTNYPRKKYMMFLKAAYLAARHLSKELKTFIRVRSKYPYYISLLFPEKLENIKDNIASNIFTKYVSRLADTYAKILSYKELTPAYMFASFFQYWFISMIFGERVIDRLLRKETYIEEHSTLKCCASFYTTPLVLVLFEPDVNNIVDFIKPAHMVKCPEKISYNPEDILNAAMFVRECKNVISSFLRFYSIYPSYIISARRGVIKNWETGKAISINPESKTRFADIDSLLLIPLRYRREIFHTKEFEELDIYISFEDLDSISSSYLYKTFHIVRRSALAFTNKVNVYLEVSEINVYVKALILLLEAAEFLSNNVSYSIVATDKNIIETLSKWNPSICRKVTNIPHYNKRCEDKGILYITVSGSSVVKYDRLPLRKILSDGL